jgi:very-short-patch-repair endonuclease
MARRRTETPTQRKLSEALRRKYVKVRNEKEFSPSTGYAGIDRRADIDVPQYGAIVEVDGGYHRKWDDDLRDEEFRKIGRRTIRIKNHVVERDPDAAADLVIAQLKQGVRPRRKK